MASRPDTPKLVERGADPILDTVGEPVSRNVDEVDDENDDICVIIRDASKTKVPGFNPPVTWHFPASYNLYNNIVTDPSLTPGVPYRQEDAVYVKTSEPKSDRDEDESDEEGGEESDEISEEEEGFENVIHVQDPLEKDSNFFVPEIQNAKPFLSRSRGHSVTSGRSKSGSVTTSGACTDSENDTQDSSITRKGSKPKRKRLSEQPEMKDEDHDECIGKSKGAVRTRRLDTTSNLEPKVSFDPDVVFYKLYEFLAEQNKKEQEVRAPEPFQIPCEDSQAGPSRALTAITEDTTRNDNVMEAKEKEKVMAPKRGLGVSGVVQEVVVSEFIKTPDFVSVKEIDVVECSGHEESVATKEPESIPTLPESYFRRGESDLSDQSKKKEGYEDEVVEPILGKAEKGVAVVSKTVIPGHGPLCECLNSEGAVAGGDSGDGTNRRCAQDLEGAPGLTDTVMGWLWEAYHAFDEWI